MARKTTISREGLEFLIGAVKNTINIDDIINNEDLADNKTYSNIKIEERIDDKIDEKLANFDGGAGDGKIINDENVATDKTYSSFKIEERFDELFQSVSSGKILVANAITGKGVSTGTNATFATMASNISNITNYTASEKQALANAITSKGVSTGTNATFSTMASNIRKITNYTASEKQALANAISDKGVSTSSTDSFSTMATNISKIPQTTPWKEETVSATADSTTHIAKFIFSNTVLGVRQLTPVGYHYKAEVKGTKMFTITSNCVEVCLPDGGTWHMTAMVWNSTMT